VELSYENGAATMLNVNDTAVLASNVMYTVSTTSETPACYMYTYIGSLTSNSTASARLKDGSPAGGGGGADPAATAATAVSSWNELLMPFEKSLTLVAQSLLNLVFGIPLVRHK